MGLLSKVFKIAAIAAFLITPLFATSVQASSNGSGFDIDRARWDDNRLEVRGNGDRGQTVTVTNADTGAFVGDDRVDSGEWRVRVENPPSVPCRVRATQSESRP